MTPYSSSEASLLDRGQQHQKSVLGVPGACISNLLKRTFSFMRISLGSEEPYLFRTTRHLRVVPRLEIAARGFGQEAVPSVLRELAALKEGSSIRAGDQTEIAKEGERKRRKCYNASKRIQAPRHLILKLYAS
jgi:hypothetical protein